MQTSVAEPLDQLTSRVRENPKSIQLTKPVTPEELEDSIREVIHTKFFDHLVVSRMPGEERWLVKTRDTDFMYGFSIKHKASTIVVGHGMNTWSLWMRDYTRENLAQKLGAKILCKGALIDPKPEEIHTFLSWLRAMAKDEDQDKVTQFYVYQLEKVPTVLRAMEGSFSLM